MIEVNFAAMMVPIALAVIHELHMFTHTMFDSFCPIFGFLPLGEL